MVKLITAKFYLKATFDLCGSWYNNLIIFPILSLLILLSDLQEAVQPFSADKPVSYLKQAHIFLS